jgi:hypothetical protein
MTGLRSRSLAALVLIVSLAACKKEGAGDSVDLPAEMKPHPAQGDPSKLAVPPLFAYVPADTPYLFAGLDSVPPEFFARMKAVFQPLIALISRDWQKQRGENPMFDAVMSEMDGKWNEAGIESLGFLAKPRFALYGLGLQPFVVRVAVKDDKAVKATIERIAAKAGKDLPATASKDGRSYWEHANDDGTKVVIGLADNQAIVAVGKAADVDAKLGLILGSEKPAQNMADGALIKQLMARHGLGGQLIGYADTKQITGKALEAAGAAPSPACTGEIDRLSGKLPRVVFGYGEMSDTKVSGAVIFELAPDAVADLRAIRTEVPGLAAVLSGTPLFAIAGGADLAKAQQLAVAVAGNLKQLGAACGLGSLVDGADRAAVKMARPLPEPAGRITGGAIVIDDFDMALGKDAMPKKLDGVVLVASPDARALFDKAAELAPPLKTLGIAADGKLHDVASPMPLPFPVAAGVGDRLIALTAGDPRRAPTEKLLGTRGGGKAPLLAFSYNFARLMDFALQSMKMQAEADPAMQDTWQSLRTLFGHVSAAIDVTDHGLAMWTTVDFK